MALAEKRLLQDTQLFDEFLDEKNQSAFDAMTTAEKEINRHKQKVNQIKALNAQIVEVRADICRLEDYFALKDDIKQFIFLVDMNQSNSDNRPISMSCSDWKNKWEKIVSRLLGKCGKIKGVYIFYNENC